MARLLLAETSIVAYIALFFVNVYMCISICVCGERHMHRDRYTFIYAFTMYVNSTFVNVISVSQGPGFLYQIGN